MHIHNFLKGKKEKFSFSVEIIPPPRGSSAKDILALVESLMPYGPKWVDVTSHSGDVEWQEKGDGTFVKRIKRERPGTFGLCALIKNTFGIEAVPHVLCNGFAKSETEDALIELNFLGIKN